MDLQLRAREYLKRYGIKKKYLASLIGIYPSQLSQWLSGEYDLNTNQIKIIEDFCNGKSQYTDTFNLYNGIINLFNYIIEQVKNAMYKIAKYQYLCLLKIHERSE